eukprot:GDKI01041738.1.p1 GENE.GDKI01041738.1~~GDKI01041738.1.p1  ORF type:complete len:330 (+),score=93.60 GDKI01041738.1:43-990(+)
MILRTLLFACVALVTRDLGVYAAPGKAVYAVNCGGPKHIDSALKITYLQDKGYSSGIASDEGKKFSPMPRVADDTVYQSERYDLKSFSYEIPVRGQGAHTIVLKFSEVYFQAPGEKVFDVSMGGKKTLKNIDIFGQVGKGVPHDEYVEISVEGDALFVEGQKATSGWDSKSKMLTIKFLKGKADNPKINAIVLYEGTTADVPKLPPYDPNGSRQTDPKQQQQEEDDFEALSEEEGAEDVGGYDKQEVEHKRQLHSENVDDEEDIWGDKNTPTPFYLTAPGLLVIFASVIGVTVWAMGSGGQKPSVASEESKKKKK